MPRGTDPESGRSANDPIADMNIILQPAEMGDRRATHSLYSYALLFVAILLGGCGEGVERVGEHRFLVPKESLVPENSYPFFLPPPKEDGFIFLLNPSAEVTEQRSVLVQEREVVCARASGLKARVN